MAAAHVAAEAAGGVGNAAVVVLARDTWEVRAWVGSSGWDDRARKGAIDFATTGRSPGSTLKPFLYALALERALITPATVLDDLARGPGGIANADETFLGPLLPRMALANSRSVPAASLLDRIGLEAGYDFFREIGLHDGREPASRYGLGLAIGGMPTTLERLLRAYTALAGVSDLVWWEGQPRRSRRVLAPAVVQQVTAFLADPLARLPTFPRMGPTEYPFPVAVKTGTSSDYRDAWTVAWSSRWLVGVWTGDADQRPMDRRSGYLTAARLTRDVLLRLHRGGDDAQGLADLAPRPPGFVEARLCALSGARATAACDRVLVEWFRPGDAPGEDCTVHVRIAVDRRNGAVASAATPDDERQVRTVAVLPARYAAWAKAQRLTPVPPAPRSGDPGSLARAVAPAGATPRLRVTSPEPGTLLVIDPEAPASLSTLSLAVTVDPPAHEVVWWVDGERWTVAALPGAVRWPLTRGEHVFQARLGTGESSAPVRVRVD